MGERPRRGLGVAAPAGRATRGGAAGPAPAARVSAPTAASAEGTPPVRLKHQEENSAIQISHTIVIDN